MCGFGLFVRVKDGMLDFVETVLFGPRVIGWLAWVWDGLGRRERWECIMGRD